MSKLYDRWSGKTITVEGHTYTVFPDKDDNTLYVGDTFTPISPTPNYPQPLVTNIPAGTYKVPCTQTRGDYWEFVLPELNGLTGYQDVVEIDEWGGVGRYKSNTAIIASYSGETITTPYMSTTGQLTTGAKIVYALATLKTTLLTLKRVSTSTATDLPVTSMGITEPSPDYPFSIVDALTNTSGNTVNWVREGREQQFISLSSVGALGGVGDAVDYLEWDGNDWWKVENTGLLVLDGTETISKYTYSSTGKYAFLVTSPSILQDVSSIIPLGCNAYQWVPNTELFFFATSTVTQGVSLGSRFWGGQNRLCIKDNRFSTDSELNTYISTQYATGTPVTVRHKLATSIRTKINLPPPTTAQKYSRIYIDNSIIPPIIDTTAKCLGN